MAGSATTELKVKVGVTGDKNLTRLSRSLSNLGRDTAKANFNFKRFTSVLKEKERVSTKSVNTTRNFQQHGKSLLIASGLEVMNLRLLLHKQKDLMLN